MLTPFPFVSNPVIFGPRKWEFVSLCTEDCLKGWNHFSNPWCGITFPTPGVGNTFPSLGRKQYQSDSTPGMEKLLHFSILSPQISILPWLGLHKAWNLQMNLGVTLKKNIPQLKSKLCQSGRAGIRTGDLLCHNRRLSRLSYFETWLKIAGKNIYLCYKYKFSKKKPGLRLLAINGLMLWSLMDKSIFFLLFFNKNILPIY